MVAGLSPAGDLMADHVHHDGAHHTHEQVAHNGSQLQQARHLQRHHEFGKAADLLADLIDENPLNREAQLLYADVLLHDGRVDDARAACVRVAVSGAHTLAGYCAVQVLTATGEHHRAFGTADSLKHDQLSDEARIWALEIAAIAAWRAGRTDRAEAWFSEAMAFPDVPHSTEQAYAAFNKEKKSKKGSDLFNRIDK